jgi:peptidoglycan hydrolase-like protein with peptidoglycan-binding domain
MGLAGAAVAAMAVGRADSPAAAPTPPPATTAVQRGTLVDAATVEAELGYGVPEPLAATVTGMVTWLPEAGSTVSRGEAVLRVDERPVVLLYGRLPLYRRLAEETEGADVRQFERNLRALGYRGFTVDDVYSAATVAAVRRWQEDLELPETGVVELGRVVYTPGPVRVAAHSLRVGAAATGQVLTYTGTEKVVTASVPAGDAGWARDGARVTVLLPGGGSAAGTVTGVGTEAVRPAEQQDGPDAAAGAQDPAAATVGVGIRVPEQKKLAGLDKAPVQVRYVVEQRKDVLTVPVNALLALAEGGYGLEVVTAGSSRTVAVEVGLFADGRVEVSGAGLAEGTKVVAPR